MTENKFKVNDILRHLKRQSMYVIIVEPVDDDFLEYCAEPFYKYIALEDGTKWNRCKSEMEDGRFELVVRQS